MKKTTTAAAAAAQTRRILLQVPLGAAGALQGSSDLNQVDPTSETTNTNRISKHPLDSSMVLTILVLLTALFFVGFFSIYIRRFSEEDSPGDIRRRRHPSRRPPPGLRGSDNNLGVDPSTIQSLPLVSYCGVAKQLIADCPICLSEFEEREIVKLIPLCRHVFHPECIDTWLDSHVSCPLCRSTRFFKVADDEDEVRLDVKEEQDGNGGGERLTVGDCDTWRDAGMRRICSCTNLGDRLVLQRSMSF
ncbi:hypothetical protein ACH5RR_021046 [Cinchona calisaya]|uniref:RING-type E3 ubiquitin transferase n=1 Tax=Cinchona calisaya TaxID=153742 RepID=A0ABD2ZG73_9GENT